VEMTAELDEFDVCARLPNGAAARPGPAAMRRSLAQPAVMTCARYGRRWRLEWGRRSVLVEHRVGLLHLAVLIANPGQEISAIDLAAGGAAAGAAASAAIAGNTAAGDGVSAQPVLDRAALHAYRRRLSQLRAEIDDLEFGTDIEHPARARAERDWLTAQLASVSVIGGRTRRFPDNRERARVAVGKAIRRALTRIDEADHRIGQYLHSTVQTGTYCSYRPIKGSRHCDGFAESAAPHDCPCAAWAEVPGA
jgi:hypothetical protein